MLSIRGYAINKCNKMTLIDDGNKPFSRTTWNGYLVSEKDFKPIFFYSTQISHDGCLKWIFDKII